MAEEPQKLDLVHLEWAIAQRGKIQHTLLALYDFVNENSPEKSWWKQPHRFDHLIAAGFSLWRAAFLAAGSRDPYSIREGQVNFLAILLTTTQSISLTTRSTKHGQ